VSAADTGERIASGLDWALCRARFSNIARGEKQWVRYGRISPDDLRVLLNAGISLAETIAAREKDK
jgi:hypothetical protein